MAFQATFRHGTPLMVDHTPTSAIAAGDVVVVADVPMIAHHDIAANELGALAANGGVYEVTADAAIAKGKWVFWVDSSNKVSVTATGNKGFGITVEAATGDGDKFMVEHEPFGAVVPA